VDLVLELPSAPKPLGAGAEESLLPAKDDSLLPLAVPKGEAVLALGLARPPKGDAVELAKLPNPDALNLSSEVCGRDSVLPSSFGLGGIEANGDVVEVLANPLPEGI
jgi:hypothetical protein